MSDAQDLLQRLSSNDERSLRMVLAPLRAPAVATKPDEPRRPVEPALDGRTHVLVRLAALLALGAPTASVRWAVELASARGASDATLAAVLLSTASDAGGAQLAWSASRLALALD